MREGREKLKEEIISQEGMSSFFPDLLIELEFYK